MTENEDRGTEKVTENEGGVTENGDRVTEKLVEKAIENGDKLTKNRVG